jgi:hypothetical protein
LIAAVLGNASNRSSFLRAFWWDDERSMRLYLKAAKGDSVVREIKDPKTGKILERRTPQVVLAENPPTSAAAKANWRAARARLQALKKEIDADLAALEQVRKDCLQVAKERKSIESAEAEHRQAAARREQAEALLAECKVDADELMREYRARIAALDLHRRARPHLFARLFRTQRWQAWSMQQTPLAEAKHETARGVAAGKKALLEATTTLAVLSDRLRTLDGALLKPRRKIAKLTQSIDPWRSVLAERLVDEQFFARSHESLNLSSAWLPDSLQRKREELFAAAMAVHKAFIDASAQKMLHNLSWLMDVLASGAMRDETQRELLADLLSTLFVVVPVISTTFASVDRMLGDLPPASIGWLFIDEAGQALPQAAVGAIMRAKRSVVVGDPLQIPPFVSLPQRLTTEICAFFNVDHGDWAAPEASVQTLADRASRFQCAFDSDRGPRRVGIPLLVHRRCQDPMFSVSNVIAYNGLMVHAPGPRDPGSIGRVLGHPQWFDLDGDAQSKWCEAEGELVIDLLHRLAAAGIEKPDLFIITPFRIVAQSMRRRLEQDVSLLKALRVDSKEWISDRVGTIHTFQGGEADTVILLLGAPKATQHGARSWAANTPNILNVAVSRAQQNFYVVGSHGAWSGVGHCRELARHFVSGALPACRLGD